MYKRFNEPSADCRASELLRTYQQENYRRTDRLFAILMALQFVGGIVAALLIAPRTWTGAMSQVHVHVWAAVVLGGMLALMPITLALLMPGRAITRHVIACAQLMFSGLLIHLTGGRIETHFHVFGSLAVLAIYRDWRVLISASLITAIDHVLRAILWPESVFGVMHAAWWRAMEHAGWVVFIDIFLIRGTVMATREMKEIANRRADLEAAHNSVEQTVQQRTAELEQANESLTLTLEELQQAEAGRDQAQIELLDASRRAGMAEVATGVLHNVGNVLNSVNISGDTASRQAERLPIEHLKKAVAMLQDNADDLPGFFQNDPKAARLPGFLDQLAKTAGQEQQQIVDEMAKLRSRVDHIRHIIDAQQKHGSAVVLAQRLPLRRLVEEAIEINAGSFENHGIELVMDWQGPAEIENDRHMIMQILINLFSNAKRAIKQAAKSDKRISVKTEHCTVDGRPGLSLSITDNGIGIPAENLDQIFQHGFTTNREGHGFGLHSSANAARTMGGNLTVHSDGPGTGAAFTLILPTVSVGQQEASTA